MTQVSKYIKPTFHNYFIGKYNIKLHLLNDVTSDSVATKLSIIKCV